MTVKITETMTLNTVAAEMGVIRKTVRRWCRSGDLNAEKVFGTWAIRPEDLLAFKEKRAKPRVRQGPSPTMVSEPKRARRKILKNDSENMRRVHERADQLVAARQAFLRKKFPNGAPYQEVYEYVLYNMPPKGLRNSETEYEDEVIYE